MKRAFIGAVLKREPDYEKIVSRINELDYTNVAICYSNQFIQIAKKVSEKIDKNITGIIQVLGCSNPKFKPETEAIIIMGEGDFHPVSLAYESKLPTFVVQDTTLRTITEEEISRMEKKERGALLKYLTSDKVGILVTTKPGQYRLKKAIEFHHNLKEKKSYLFIDNHMDINQFENFGLTCWVNTACPRMDLTEGPIINLEKIPSDLIK